MCAHTYLRPKENMGILLDGWLSHMTFVIKVIQLKFLLKMA